MNLFGRLLVASLSLVVVGCSTGYDRRLNDPSVKYLGTGELQISPEAKESLAMRKSYWDGEGQSGAPSIVISLSKQTASFYKGSRLVGVSAISSGREGHDTPPGKYTVLQRDLNHASSEYGDFNDPATGKPVQKNVAAKDPKPPGTVFVGAPMPYFMRLTWGGVGMHQGFLPGVPDSHGCIRMPEKMVKIYWDNTPVGTPVTIVP